MTITSRHDNSATILEKIRVQVSQRVRFTKESTAFDMGVQATRDNILSLIDHLEKTGDKTSNS